MNTWLTMEVRILFGDYPNILCMASPRTSVASGSTSTPHTDTVNYMKI